jgi:ribonucleoside-diphosphate reductase alpha chain
MTSNKDIPFAKSLIDYIFCWLGCRFIPGYAEKNTPNRAAAAPKESKNTTTAKQLVERAKDLAHKIAEAKAETKTKTKTALKERQEVPTPELIKRSSPLTASLTEPTLRLGSLVASPVAAVPGSEQLQTEVKVLEQFNAQFTHFSSDAPVCDICGSITVRNGTCYKCFNCGNSMGCS